MLLLQDLLDSPHFFLVKVCDIVDLQGGLAHVLVLVIDDLVHLATCCGAIWSVFLHGQSLLARDEVARILELRSVDLLLGHGGRIIQGLRPEICRLVSEIGPVQVADSSKSIFIVGSEWVADRLLLLLEMFLLASGALLPCVSELVQLLAKSDLLGVRFEGLLAEGHIGSSSVV